MTTYVLVLGVGHGSWCWQGTIERLTAAGHVALAVDLPLTTLDDDVAAVAALLRPTSFAVLAGPLVDAPWTTIGSTHVVCARDKAIDPGMQRAMFRRAASVVELDTDHSPFMSEPEALHDILVSAAP